MGEHDAMAPNARETNPTTPIWTESAAPLDRQSVARVFAFAVLGIAMLVLTLDVQTLFLPHPALDDDFGAWSKLDSGAQKLLDLEYRTVIDEIKLRLERDQNLFQLKFVFVGAIFALLLKRSIDGKALTPQRHPWAVLVGWSAAITASIIDLRISDNQKFLGILGGWVRRYEQSFGAAYGWEHFLEKKLLLQQLYPTLRSSINLLTVPVFCVVAYMLLYVGTRPRRLIVVSAFGALFCLAIQTIVAFSYEQHRFGTTCHVIAAVLGVAATICLAITRPETARHPFITASTNVPSLDVVLPVSGQQ